MDVIVPVPTRTRQQAAFFPWTTTTGGPESLQRNREIASYRAEHELYGMAARVSKPSKAEMASERRARGEQLLREAKDAKPAPMSNLLTELEKINKGFISDPRVLINSFCEEKSIPLFDWQDVYPYMDKIIKAERVRAGEEWLVWYWRDLFAGDHEMITYSRTTQYQHMAQNGTGMRPPWFIAGGNILGKYDKPIPIDILNRAKEIRTAYGPEVQMHVTDYGLSDSDPFIRGRYRGYKFIFGFWDEPGFGLD